MSYYYSTNINVQLMIALLKEHGIKKVIASPGTTNLEFIASLQHDSFFELYSCVDERSAAYMACGLAAETGEPVVITCTEATASRNYYSGMTEAYHRKLPILAVTGLHAYSGVGHLEPQVIDRSVSPKDAMRRKINLPAIKDESDYKESELLINTAILELKRNGGGPVHINMPWAGPKFDFSVQNLPKVRVIKRYTIADELPELKHGKIVVVVGSHGEWSEKQTAALDRFCAKYDAAVFCDHGSKYYGKYRVLTSMIVFQKLNYDILQGIDVVIHIGEEIGDDNLSRKIRAAKETWRVSLDGEIRDTFKNITKIFEMGETQFFSTYAGEVTEEKNTYYLACREVADKLNANLPKLPFSSVYVASKISARLPENSVIHFGVSDTIRAWSFFELPDSVRTSSNLGCRGIDGCVSALIGASFADGNKLYFGVVGDLTFFYDMNSLGNRHIRKNLRLLIVNNDGGNIFRRNGHPSQVWLGFEEANKYIAAAGHFGRRSPDFVKNYAENLGFEYLTASNYEEFDTAVKRFTTPEMTDKPMLFEIFTESKDDSNAFEIMANVDLDTKGHAKAVLKQVLGEKGMETLRKIIK